MPNQRDPRKRKLSAWMFEKDINLLRAEALSRNIPLSELLLKLTDDLKKRNNKSNK